MRVRIKDMVVYVGFIAAFLLAVYGGNKTVAVVAEMYPTERKNCIVIDPGHGGVDGGATSCTGILESRYNLEISARLNALFRFLGYETKMIRTEDVSVYTKGETIAEKKISDLKERVRIVNETAGALLISIHQNIYSDSRYSGAQVFYSNTEGSRELAQALQAAFLTKLNPGSTRKIKRCEGVYLMEHIQQRGVLIECGFLSNPEETVKLGDAQYQRKLCCIIAGVVSSYLSNT